ncbi:unnamed protein product [Pipistrellus nathusii]|uniref:Uncharacterized protein n=1 Tax=Pipistrellus nathusii TaxID=59473 RepID=A0ABP0AHC7_PIPNA
MKLVIVLMLTALPLFCYAGRTRTIVHKLPECLSLLGGKKMAIVLATPSKEVVPSDLSRLLCAFFPGSGCQDINYVFKKLLDPQESKTEFILDVEEFINSGITEMALKEFKQCFLDQSDETLNNFGDLVVMVASSSRSGCSGRGPVVSQFSTNYFFLSHYFLRCIFIDFREEGRGREREKLQ